MTSPPAFGPVQRLGLRHSLAGQVLKAIFEGQLREGDRLVVVRLAEQFGVSATPAREALLELNAIGMVDMLPNRGAVVRPFGPPQLAEIYQIRRILETEATRCACRRIPPGDVEPLLDEMRQLAEGPGSGKWSARAMTADRRLHEMITDHCGSERLADEIRRYGTLVQIAREVVDNHQHAQRAALAEHVAILEALRATDPDRAAAAMARHIDSAAEVFSKELFPSGDRRKRK